jgi:hypothetical protein
MRRALKVMAVGFVMANVLTEEFPDGGFPLFLPGETYSEDVLQRARKVCKYVGTKEFTIQDRKWLGMKCSALRRM